jgi:hypothetical protein
LIVSREIGEEGMAGTEEMARAGVNRAERRHKVERISIIVKQRGIIVSVKRKPSLQHLR